MYLSCAPLLSLSPQLCQCGVCVLQKPLRLLLAHVGPALGSVTGSLERRFYYCTNLRPPLHQLDLSVELESTLTKHSELSDSVNSSPQQLCVLRAW